MNKSVEHTWEWHKSLWININILHKNLFRKPFNLDSSFPLTSFSSQSCQRPYILGVSHLHAFKSQRNYLILPKHNIKIFFIFLFESQQKTKFSFVFNFPPEHKKETRKKNKNKRISFSLELNEEMSCDERDLIWAASIWIYLLFLAFFFLLSLILKTNTMNMLKIVSGFMMKQQYFFSWKRKIGKKSKMKFW